MNKKAANKALKAVRVAHQTTPVGAFALRYTSLESNESCHV